MQELFHVHLLEEEQTMSGPEPRAGVLVEERLAEYALYFGELVYPDDLGQVAELAVEHVAREVGVYL